MIKLLRRVVSGSTYPVSAVDARSHTDPPDRVGEDGDQAVREPDSTAATSVRRFTGLAATAAGLAGLGLLTTQPRTAHASYIAGAGPNGWDLINNWVWNNGGMVMLGNLAIGTGNPSHHVTINNTGNTYVVFKYSEAMKAYVGWETNGGSGLIVSETSTSSGLIRISPAGNVGIGTNAPTAKLEVAGTVKVNGNLALDATGGAVKAYYAQ